MNQAAPKKIVGMALIFAASLLCMDASSAPKKADATGLLKKEVARLREETAQVKNSVQLHQEAGRSSHASMETRLEELNKEQKDLKAELQRVEESASRSGNASRWGAIIILIGMMIEIIGATFLASDAITKKCEPVRNLNPVEPSLDLSLENVALRPMLTFLTYLGAFLVFFGFTIQTAGTFLVLDLPWFWMLLIPLVMSGIAFWVSYFVAGRSLEQTPKERFLTVLDNATFAFGKALLYSFNTNPKCDMCGEPVKKNEQFISFFFRQNSQSHPYLNAPSSLHVGHKKCLEYRLQKKLGECNTQGQKEEILGGTQFLDRESFLTWAKGMDSWHEAWRAAWAEQRKNDLGEGSWYRDLQRTKKRLGSV